MASKGELLNAWDAFGESVSRDNQDDVRQAKLARSSR